MALNEKEKTTIKDLQTQEQTCIKKYKKYGQDAKDPVLKDLFSTLEKNEQKHYDTLGQILEGKVPECDCNDCEGKEYEPEATYDVPAGHPLHAAVQHPGGWRGPGLPGL